MDPFVQIKSTNDLDYLIKQRDVFIPIDRENLKKESNKQFYEHIGINWDDHVHKQTLLLNKLENAVLQRIKQLQK